MTDDKENIENEDYKIVEDQKQGSPIPKIAIQVKKAQSAVIASMVMIIEEKENLDADNLFNIRDAKGDDICILTKAIPCRNPHCMSCNMVHIYSDKADDVTEMLANRLAVSNLKQYRKTMSDAKKEFIDSMMDTFRQFIEEGKE